MIKVKSIDKKTDWLLSEYQRIHKKKRGRVKPIGYREFFELWKQIYPQDCRDDQGRKLYLANAEVIL